MKEYLVAFPIPEHYVVGQSLLPFFSQTQELLLGSGLHPDALCSYTQSSHPEYDNNLVVWNVRCTAEMLTIVILKTNALLL